VTEAGWHVLGEGESELYSRCIDASLHDARDVLPCRPHVSMGTQPCPLREVSIMLEKEERDGTTSMTESMHIDGPHRSASESSASGCRSSRLGRTEKQLRVASFSSPHLPTSSTKYETRNDTHKLAESVK
jgi:hypothetical protein